MWAIASCSWLGCERTVELNPINFGRASLEVIWASPKGIFSDNKDNAIVRIYDNEEDFLVPGGRYIAEKSISDIYPPHGGLITPVDRVTFDNLAPVTHWVKLFNAYSSGNLIEHNLDAGFKTAMDLQEHTHNAVIVNTTTAHLQAYQIHSITLHTVPMAEGFLSPNQHFRVDIHRMFRYSSPEWPNTLLYSGVTSVGDLPVTLRGLDIQIDGFSPRRDDPALYINIGQADAEGSYGQYEFQVFGLLKHNTSLSGDLHYWDQQNRKIFTLHGTFIFQDQP